MTASIDTYRPTLSHERSDEALAIVDRYRRSVDEQFHVDKLEAEFPRLAAQLGGTGLYLARCGDNLVGAFKWRGALTGAAHLKEQGVESIVVPSAGNHLRGAVLAAKLLDMDIHGVVPTTAPPAKKEGVRALWPDPRFQLHEVGASFDESLAWALEHPEYGALLHPFDDPYVSAGQGTVVDDVFTHIDRIDHIVVPVGGGGLLAGILDRLHQLEHHDTVVHAVEASGSNSLSMSLANNQLTSAERPNGRFGGSAVRHIGHHTLAICRNSPNLRTVSITDEEVDNVTEDYEQDRYDLWRTDTPNYEPTTLVAIAGLARVAADNPNDTVLVVGTGHNDSLWQKQRNILASTAVLR